ncbi:guanylyl cyclase-activating protein 3 isoform X1 [Trachypithecus francoisi]|uniref:guanylyl cyclase-activating protein 3 isoform X1 n=1 Tax=Trachypithecus francoisi TaxID=54180 RepID=UPI00141AEB72|nr:guanylyl cyclase-activating protein 3 isoform X1 [Trachypithecus francoisi]
MGNGKSIAGDQRAVPTQATHVWYRTFMTEYPSGLQTLHEFKTLLGLQGLNQKANKHIDQVYNTFDTNQDGFIDFLEFIAAVNLIVQEKMEQKLKWYFKLYDVDGNGSIDKNELLDMFVAVQALNGQQTLSPEEFTNLVFRKIDINNDGELTLEEFINGIAKDQDLLEIVYKSFNLSNVLRVICNGKQPDMEIDSSKSPDKAGLGKLTMKSL